ncbi:Serpentine Receptor, class H [Caenorhabditis elegans]|uniref:Serpentine Receptor, class H n=1 Tax=Caenorhabditis elegans TaxID=6239 RepID=Q9XXQ1_CAEEL|nr:Serpentine Receptor, class H [Caenorhabditis elegans]CAA16418.1 Serpentine Receptor, class H [Caenorhabditis elegans]|eukprot:NP_507359.1 Serpentine Receptor, class H [Caenorhabditis elegans]
MTSAIEKYYTTNYSQCNLDYNFLASWKGVAYPSHVIQFISLPFQILAFYVIIFKTPVSMKNVRVALLVNHVLCALLDIALCTFSTVYIFLPMYGMFFVGILSLFSVPNTVQFLIVYLMGTFTSASYVYLFESRSSTLVQNKFRIIRGRTRMIYYSLFLFPFIFLIYFMNFESPDKEASKLSALIEYPCPTREFFTSEVSFLLTNKTLKESFIWLVPIGAFHLLIFPLFQVATLIYYICIAPSKTTSKDTQNKQKVFLFCILFQTSVPIILGVCPLSLCCIAYASGHYSQGMMNIVVCCIGLHGLTESIAILTVHRPYRKAIGHMFSELKKKRCLLQVSSFPVNLTSDSLTRG